MNKSVIAFCVHATGPDLYLRIFVDGEEVKSLEPTEQSQKIEIELNDDIEQQHCLEIVMSGKQMDHTQVDADGNILKDRVIEISDINIDDIDIGCVFSQIAEYHHDFNGTADSTTEKFYGTMGCNGTVKFNFTTPMYLWLLENM